MPQSVEKMQKRESWTTPKLTRLEPTEALRQLFAERRLPTAPRDLRNK